MVNLGSHYMGLGQVEMVIALTPPQTVKVDDYPALTTIGTWVVPRDKSNLRVLTKLSQPEVITRFSQITGIEPAAFHVGVLSGIDGVWPESR